MSKVDEPVAGTEKKKLPWRMELMIERGIIKQNQSENFIRMLFSEDDEIFSLAVNILEDIYERMEKGDYTPLPEDETASA